MDYASNMYTVNLLSPQTITGSGSAVTGSAVNCKNVRDGVVIVNVGEMTAATTLTVNLTTCDTSGGTFTDVFTAAKSILTAGKNTLYAYALSEDAAARLKQYVKLVYTATNTNTVLLSVSLTGWDRVLVPVS